MEREAVHLRQAGEIFQSDGAGEMALKMSTIVNRLVETDEAGAVLDYSRSR